MRKRCAPRGDGGRDGRVPAIISSELGAFPMEFLASPGHTAPVPRLPRERRLCRVAGRGVPPGDDRVTACNVVVRKTTSKPKTREGPDKIKGLRSKQLVAENRGTKVSLKKFSRRSQRFLEKDPGKGSWYFLLALSSELGRTVRTASMFRSSSSSDGAEDSWKHLLFRILLITYQM